VSRACGSCGAALAEGARFCSACGAAVDAPAPPGAREARKVVSALFTDVVGSTALGERMDPEDFKDVVGAAVRRMAAGVERFGGEVFEYAGDGLLALFGAPVSHEDDPERAILAGLEIVESIAGYSDEVARQWEIEGFAVRVGIETGLAVLGPVGGGSKLEYGAVGDSLNTAARLQATAEPGTVVVGPRTHRLTAARFEFGEPAELELKGKAERVSARRVLRPVLAAGAGATTAVGAELVGREEELRRGVESIEATLAGSGRVLFLVGEAGIGKSRLAAELRRRFELGDSPGGEPRWLEGRCVSYGEALPYWPFRGLLREWLGQAAGDREGGGGVGAALRAELERLAGERGEELAEPIGIVLGLTGVSSTGPDPAPQVVQDRIQAAVADVLERLAAEGPLGIFLDDLHWADASSVALTERLLELTERAPILVVLTARPERGHPVWGVRERALRELPHRAREAVLEGLGRERDRELLVALVGADTLPGELERRVLARAEGNPFYLEELVRSMVEAGALRREDGGWSFDREVPVEIPETVEKVILARIDRLTAPAQELLGVAAVLGRQFPIPLLEAVAADADAAEPLRELQTAGLLRDAARWPVPLCAFKHTLIQEATYRGLLRRRRQELHARALDAVESLYRDRLDEFAGMAAHHATAAGDDRRAFDYQRRAGRRAARVHAVEEALDHYAGTLDAARRLGLDASDPGVREARLRRGQLLLTSGELEPAREDLEAALAAAEIADDHETRVAAALDLAAYWRAHDFSRATELIEETARASEAMPPRTRVNALARLAIQYVNQLRFERALEVGERALALAEAEGDERSVLRALDALKLVALQTGEIGHLERLTGRLLAFFEERSTDQRAHEDEYYLPWVMLEAAFVPIARGHWDEAILRVEEAVELTRRHGSRFFEPLFIDALCWAHRSKGDYGRALAHGRAASAIGHRLRTTEWASWADATLGWALLEARAPEAAAECLERGVSTAEDGAAPAPLARCSALLGWARLLLGDPEGAGSMQGHAEELLGRVVVPAGGAWLFGAHAYLATARVELSLGDPRRAVDLVEPIAAAAERSGWAEPLASGSLVIGLACAAADDATGAEAAFAEAIGVADRIGLPAPAWEARLGLAKLLEASGRDDEAAEHRRRAEAIVNELAGSLDEPELREGLLGSLP
jgi:predicted ATPase/class 3 adenylate cyclase